MRWSAIVLGVVWAAGCSREDDRDGGRFDCGGPKEENLAGDDAQREVEQMLASGGRAAMTMPGGHPWQVKRIGSDLVLQVADTSYALVPNAAKGGWNVMLSSSDDQIRGEFAFFTYVVETAIDEDHCTTGGHKLAITHDGKAESFRTQRGIK